MVLHVRRQDSDGVGFDQGDIIRRADGSLPEAGARHESHRHDAPALHTVAFARSAGGDLEFPRLCLAVRPGAARRSARQPSFVPEAICGNEGKLPSV
jgi:hypothetical protein